MSPNPGCGSGTEDVGKLSETKQDFSGDALSFGDCRFHHVEKPAFPWPHPTLQLDPPSVKNAPLFCRKLPLPLAT